MQIATSTRAAAPRPGWIRFAIPLLVIAMACLPSIGVTNARADEMSDAISHCNAYTARTGIACDAQRCPCGRSTTEIERWDRRGVRISVCACASRVGPTAPVAVPLVNTCRTDAQCDDGVFCNGVERCELSGPAGGGSRQVGSCVAAASPCPTGLCLEQEKRCRIPCEDRDGDGHNALHCGGDDCDDNNPNRFPGNIEVCESKGVDEDCDAATVGVLDIDGDGYVSDQCR